PSGMSWPEASAHRPPTQVWAPQEWPHMPQLAASVRRSTQAPLQLVRPLLQVKVAVTSLTAEVSATMQSPVPPQPLPDQPAKVCVPWAGAASLTGVVGKVALQSAVQSIPDGVDVTVPPPVWVSAICAEPVPSSVDWTVPPGEAETISIADLAST